MGQAGLFAAFRGIAEEDLAGDGEDGFIGEAIKERREKIGLDPHVAVQQHYDIVFRGAKSGIRTAAEAEILRQGKQLHFGIVRGDPIRAAIDGTVVDHDDFAAG